MFRFLAFFKRTLVSLIKRSFRSLGYEIVSDSSSYMTMDGGHSRLQARQIPIATVIDVGASNGRWSELCIKHFPNAYYHLLEAQQEYSGPLEKMKKAFPKLDYSIKVVSDEAGEIYFDDHIVGGGVANREKVDANFKKKKACTIDDEIKMRQLPAPYFIKLDTHGFEIPILTGAKESMKQASAILIECYNFRLNENAKQFHEMVAYMAEQGFRPADIVDLSLRAKDQVLWQMDIFFLRSELKQFEDNSYE